MAYDYKKLITWQRSIELVDEIYKLTKYFPSEEKYGLISQMRRSAVSIPSNIAEGCMRSSKKEYRQFIFIAFSSGAELETQIVISKRQQFIDEENFIKLESILNEVMRMLNKTISSLSN